MTNCQPVPVQIECKLIFPEFCRSFPDLLAAPVIVAERSECRIRIRDASDAIPPVSEIVVDESGFPFLSGFAEDGKFSGMVDGDKLDGVRRFAAALPNR